MEITAIIAAFKVFHKYPEAGGAWIEEFYKMAQRDIEESTIEKAIKASNEEIKHTAISLNPCIKKKPAQTKKPRKTAKIQGGRTDR